MRTGKMLVGAAVVFGVMLFCAEAPAEEEAVDPLITVAVARAKAEIALRKAKAATDRNKSGWDKTYRSFNPLYNECNRLLDNARKEEESKAEVKDQGFIDDCNEKRKEIGRKWTKFHREYADLDVTIRATLTTYNDLQYAFNYLPNSMGHFKKAEGDLSGYASVHEAIRKRVEEVRTEAAQTMDDLKAKLREWETELSDVKEFAGVAPEEE